MKETDEERLERIDRTGLFMDSRDILLQAKRAKPLTSEEIDCLLEAVRNEEVGAGETAHNAALTGDPLAGRR